MFYGVMFNKLFILQAFVNDVLWDKFIIAYMGDMKDNILYAKLLIKVEKYEFKIPKSVFHGAHY